MREQRGGVLYRVSTQPHVVKNVGDQTDTDAISQSWLDLDARELRYSAPTDE